MKEQMNQGVSRERLLTAFHRADWGQVVANGGPPCFHMMREGNLCLRAERWPGHPVDHHFVSLQIFTAALLDECENLRLGWRPIETAPKDKSVILWDGKCAYLAEWVSDFHGRNDGAWTDHSVKSFGYEEENFVEHPTHWRPLPDPPDAAISENAANDTGRCKICGWPLAESRDLGCFQGDCSYRPEDGSPEWYRIKARRDALASSEVEQEQDGSVSGAGQ